MYLFIFVFFVTLLNKNFYRYFCIHWHMNNIINYLLNLSFSLDDYLIGHFDDLHLQFRQDNLPWLFWNYFCWYFDNTVNFFNSLAINFNRYLNSHIFCYNLFNFYLFYNFFLYLPDHWSFNFFNHFPHDFSLYFNLFLDESIDVNRNLFLNLFYHFSLDINRHLLLNDFISFDKYWFFNLFDLFHDNRFLDLDPYFTYHLDFYFNGYFLYYFDYLFLFDRNLFYYFKRNLLFDLLNNLFLYINYLFNLNRYNLLNYYLSYHLYFFDDFHFLDNFFSNIDFYWNLYNLTDNLLVLAFKIYLGWNFYNLIHFLLDNDFVIDQDLSRYFNYLYFNVLLDWWFIGSKVVNDIVYIIYQAMINLLEFNWFRRVFLPSSSYDIILIIQSNCLSLILSY